MNSVKRDATPAELSVLGNYIAYIYIIEHTLRINFTRREEYTDENPILQTILTLPIDDELLREHLERILIGLNEDREIGRKSAATLIAKINILQEEQKRTTSM